MHELFQCRTQESFLDTFEQYITQISPVKRVNLWVRDIPFASYKSVGQPTANQVLLELKQIEMLQQERMIWSTNRFLPTGVEGQLQDQPVVAGLYVNHNALYGWLELTFQDVRHAREKNSEITELMQVAGYAFERFVLLSILGMLTSHAEAEPLANSDLLTALSGYVSQLSHQLKNPMTSIRGYSDLLTSGFLGEITEQQSKSLETVIYNLDRVNEGILVPNSIFKLYANRLQKQKQPEQIQNLVLRVCEAFKRASARQQVQMVCDVPVDLTFETDRLYFEEALRGIVKTCLHFMESNQKCKIGASMGDCGLLVNIDCRVDFFKNIDVIDDFDSTISSLLIQGKYMEMYALWKKSLLLWEFLGGKICGVKLSAHSMQLKLLLCEQ